MQVLVDKATKTDYNSISRYSSFPYYYHTKDRKYIYGITGQLNQDIPFVSHEILMGDTLDNLSLKYYGRPDLYWVIADFNNIQDPFVDLSNYLTIDIPTLSAISFESL